MADKVKPLDKVWVPRSNGGKTKATVGKVDGPMAYCFWTESRPVCGYGDLMRAQGNPCVEHTEVEMGKWVNVTLLTPA